MTSLTLTETAKLSVSKTLVRIITSRLLIRVRGLLEIQRLGLCTQSSSRCKIITRKKNTRFLSRKMVTETYFWNMILYQKPLVERKFLLSITNLAIKHG